MFCDIDTKTNKMGSLDLEFVIENNLSNNNTFPTEVYIPFSNMHVHELISY